MTNNTVSGPQNVAGVSGIIVQNLEQTGLDIEVTNNTITGYQFGVLVAPLAFLMKKNKAARGPAAAH